MKKKTDKSKSNLKKLIIVIAFVVLIVIVIRYTFSRFQSDANAVAKMDAAFYIVDEGFQTMDINLGTIVPRERKYEYDFSIANYNGNERAEVDLEYDLTIVATTNLPLQYDLFMNGSTTTAVTSNSTAPDDDGTYFRTLTTATQVFHFNANEKNTYKLTVYFDPALKDIKYQDIIEGIEIQVDSRQIIE